MLEKEFRYFQDHKKEFKKKYPHKFVVIVGERIVGVFSSSGEALQEASKEYKLGTFLIQQIFEKDDDYVQRFHSGIFA